MLSSQGMLTTTLEGGGGSFIARGTETDHAVSGGVLAGSYAWGLAGCVGNCSVREIAEGSGCRGLSKRGQERWESGAAGAGGKHRGRQVNRRFTRPILDQAGVRCC